VKLANIAVTEKRALAVFNNKIVLHQFLDATAAFDETLHPIILNQMFNGRIEDDLWKYFELLHRNSTTHLKWSGLSAVDAISEGKGNRQGGLASGDEWKLYNNEMISQLEDAASPSDRISGVSTSCVAVADDVAPCVTGDHPREALHQMQHLISIVEDHGTQLHMKFGKEKCKLLISGRPNTIRKVQTLLKTEPELLTFYGTPVQTVEDKYIHIGVPQAPFKQSQVMADYRIEKGQNISYKLQGSTKNSLMGISPLSNRKMFISYHQPSFLYGTDTMHLNTTDMERIEVKYRKVLKHMLSLPACTTSAAVYLNIGVMPASAQRDVEILGLLGQLAMCDSESQNIRSVITNTLTFYGVNFTGWSSLVRKTCHKYGLPDPLQYMQYPWRPDRWRDHCKRTVKDFWEKQLLQTVGESLKYMDMDYASLQIPMRVWQMAGLCSVNVRQATVVNWMLLGVYFTREFLHKMKKASSPICSGCPSQVNETLKHLLLHCEYYQKIRESYLPKYIQQNSQLSEIFSNEDLIVQTILDPLSSNLPDSVREGWESAKTVYCLSRQFCYSIHKRREKLYEEAD
jgi:hypothetical protein